MKNLVKLPDCVFDKTLVRAISRVTENTYGPDGKYNALVTRTKIYLSAGSTGLFTITTELMPLAVYLEMQKP